MSQQLEQVKALIELREKARLGGGQKRIDSQHQKGKYTARERIHSSATVSLQVTVLSKAVWSMYSPRTSLYSADLFLRLWP